MEEWEACAQFWRNKQNKDTLDQGLQTTARGPNPARKAIPSGP